ncbi:MAG: tRNA 5-methoxyuridine(34)/uridine 5-oxyacetic acid(34) synthase CmoB, partial [Gammaproteobacteria bacterium]|nr:tRNA 5-methoxyuridine(34)/uridine 5-oxyacetic acid(34) synthase CmoB [Gammaproteobacteria bacterium]
MQIDLERFFSATADTDLASHHDALRQALDSSVRQHGRAPEWDALLASIEEENTPGLFHTDTVEVGSAGKNYSETLTALKPWRKGPLRIGETFVDTEWRSDWKWQRLVAHLSPLKDRKVLDIGCGNGYHLFRMLGAGASLAVGVDPTILFNYQFALIQKVCADNNAFLLPLRSEHMPPFACFDTVFSMGVLYHRRSPIDHMTELFSFLKPGGELVLETLIVDSDQQTILIPEDRYAKMANVWFIPSPSVLTTMASRAGFSNPRIVDVTATTTDEQRATEWMDFESLTDFLDPTDQ